MTTGTCKHGEFKLIEGCPECVGERMMQEQGACQEETDPATITMGAEHLADHALGPVEEVTTAVIDIAPGKDQKVLALLQEVMTAKEYADKRIISSHEDDQAATNDLVMMGNLNKTVEEKRKGYVTPLNGYVKVVNDAFKLLTEPLAQAIKTTKDKATAYRLEQQRIQREQEEINRKRREAAEAEMKLKGELTESVNEVEVVEAPKLTRTDLGTSGMMDVWKYEVVDFAALPDEYKVADTAMLTKIAKSHHDKKQIPGVRFFNDPTIQTRRR